MFIINEHLQERADSLVNIFELHPETYWQQATILPSRQRLDHYQEELKRMNRSESVDNTSLKFYAFYFPQWYKTADNDWWDDWRYFNNTLLTVNGKGFPIARPKNHVYYDPRHFMTRLTQRNLARKYGIDGFIFYHYWFERPILGDVVELLLHDGEPAVEFGLLWVNEAFGSAQVSYRDAMRQALYLARFMKHPKYIHIDGRPVFYLYHTQRIPLSYLDSLMRYLIQLGLPKPYLIQCLQNYGDNMDILPYVDGYAEFAVNIGSPDAIRSYRTRSYQLGLALNYDNTPRITEGKVIPGKRIPIKPTKGRILFDEFRDKKVITDLCIKKISQWYPLNDGPKIVLIFAWNEWSEQAALEPSDILNYQLLEAIWDCRKSIISSNDQGQA